MADLHALLIGIDHYQPNPYYKCLQGAVRDIDKVAGYLEKSLQIPSERITRLTSPLPDNNTLSDDRAARQEIPPTYDNIVKSFNYITETAQAKDLVYIHYSGHGGRPKTIFPDLKGVGQYDESLVPMDVGDDGYYLRDVEMATLLKRMTDKSLIITVIFDSCHTKDRPKDSAVATREELVQNWASITQGVKMEGWLPNQRDYVFLGACRPSEFAYESAFDGKERNGALTYWMIETLISNPTGLTYQSLYDRITGQIQSRFPNQLPMLLGESDRFVFGSEIKAIQYSLTVIDVSSLQVTLNGGLAQGLSRGTRFSLYPVGSDFSDKQKCLAMVGITELQASTSIAKILTEEDSGVSAIIEKIEPGLPAVMESAPVDLKQLVRLHLKKAGDKEDNLPQEFADKQAAALEQVRQAMQINGWVTEVQGDEEGHYQVAVGKNGEYEICKCTPIKNLTPALSIDDSESPARVVKRLVHIAKYKLIETLDNPQSKLSIEFDLLDEDQQPFPDRNNIKLKTGMVYLRIKNTDNQPLNIAILDLEATWQITPLSIQKQNVAFYELDQGQILTEAMAFYVPEGEEYKNRKEKIKLFATNGIANFNWLSLPSLDEDLSRRGSSLDEELQQLVDKKGTVRGQKSQISPLNHLLSQIGADIDKSPQISRAIRPKPTPNADWTTRTIEVGFRA
jgi:hypothetical protein